VLMTSDRDAFALIDASTSVLRVRNGVLDQAVLVTAASLPEVCGVQPWQYRDYAALRGDPSDNLPGVRGFGAATAARLLRAFGSVDAAWAALDGSQAQAVRAVVGHSASEHLDSPAMRQVVNRNRRLMLMRADLPLPDLNTARLPIDRTTIRRALTGRGINLGPSLWALTGDTPPPGGNERAPLPRVWGRRARRRHDPCPGQLALF
jgi:5'-3' exonuclease